MDIIELLNAKNIIWIHKSAEEIGIVCPNAFSHAGGRDSRPSFNINMDKMVGHCFACGFSLGPGKLTRWLIGGELDDCSMKSMSIKARIKNIQDEGRHLSTSEARQVFIPPGQPWNEDGFRGIRLDTYTKLGAIRCDRGFYQDRLVFPVYLDGKLIGVDARALNGQEPKYLRNKGSTCQENWLYPYDVVKEMRPNYVILGEGIFHAVNGVDKGFPVLCFFGAHNWSMPKIRMLMALGIEYVIYFRDIDKAGYHAEQEICSTIQDWLPVYSADTSNIKDGRDLGDLSREEIQEAIDNKTKTNIPQCLPEHKPQVGAKCSIRCHFKDEKGKCQNAFW